jgi:hypothetical protein
MSHNAAYHLIMFYCMYSEWQFLSDTHIDRFFFFKKKRRRIGPAFDGSRKGDLY